MKMLFALIFIGILQCGFATESDKDSLSFSGMGSFTGMVSTGNLNQYGGNLFGKFTLHNSKWALDIKGSYNRVTVESHNVINDTWNYVQWRNDQEKNIYPVFTSYIGAAKSFGIQFSSMNAVGLGYRIPSSKILLRADISAGYVNFNYNEIPSYQDWAGNLGVLFNAALFENKVLVALEYNGYHAISESVFRAYSVNTSVSFPIMKRLNWVVRNQIVYSGIVDAGKQHYNTSTTMGIGFK